MSLPSFLVGFDVAVLVLGVGVALVFLANDHLRPKPPMARGQFQGRFA